MQWHTSEAMPKTTTIGQVCAARAGVMKMSYPTSSSQKNNEDYDKLNPEYHGKEGLLNVRSSYTLYSVSDALIEACMEQGIPFNPDFNGEK